MTITITCATEKSYSRAKEVASNYSCGYGGQSKNLLECGFFGETVEIEHGEFDSTDCSSDPNNLDVITLHNAIFSHLDEY